MTDTPETFSLKKLISIESIDQELLEWSKGKIKAEPYGYSDEIPSHDFNREMFAPGQHPKYPDGVVGIRTDDDFFVVAALPWKFKNLSVQNIVSTLWPDIAQTQDYTVSYDRGPAAELDFKGANEELLGNIIYALRAVGEVKHNLKHFKKLAEAAQDPFRYFSGSYAADDKTIHPDSVMIPLSVIPSLEELITIIECPTCSGEGYDVDQAKEKAEKIRARILGRINPESFPKE